MSPSGCQGAAIFPTSSLVFHTNVYHDEFLGNFCWWIFKKGIPTSAPQISNPPKVPSGGIIPNPSNLLRHWTPLQREQICHKIKLWGSINPTSMGCATPPYSQGFVLLTPWNMGLKNEIYWVRHRNHLPRELCFSLPFTLSQFLLHALLPLLLGFLISARGCWELPALARNFWVVELFRE